MTTIYLLSAAFILLLLSFLVTRFRTSKKQTDNSQLVVEHKTVSETSIKSPVVYKKDEIDLPQKEIPEIDLLERPQMSEKNKWLYPTDGFGIMEHGVVDNESNDAQKKG